MLVAVQPLPPACSRDDKGPRAQRHRYRRSGERFELGDRRPRPSRRLAISVAQEAERPALAAIEFTLGIDRRGEP
jgi:hypothetical protein